MYVALALLERLASFRIPPVGHATDTTLLLLPEVESILGQLISEKDVAPATAEL